jgi:hypothetical protein
MVTQTRFVLHCKNMMATVGLIDMIYACQRNTILPTLSLPSPILPYRMRQHSPHNRPMPKSTLLLPLNQRMLLPLPHNLPAPCRQSLSIHLVLRQQERLSRAAPQEIGLRGLPEGQGSGILLAEDDHVGEVGSGSVICFFVFSEDPAGGEGGLDSSDYEACGWEGEVSGVVLEF